jgi:hypothetical protein
MDTAASIISGLFSAGLAAKQAVATYRKHPSRMDAIRVQLGLIERHAADEDSAIRVFPDFRQQEEGGIIIPGGGIPVRIGQLAAPRFPPMDRSNTPNTSNTPSTPITPNTSIPWPMAGPASCSSPQIHSPPPNKVRRMMENEAFTGIMHSLKISPSLAISDFREGNARNALSDTGCEITTLYSADNNVVHPSGVLCIREMFGIDGKITPVVGVKRYVSIPPAMMLPAQIITYYVDVNLPILTVGLLVSAFKIQTPEEQDMLAWKLVEKASAVFTTEEAYNLLNDWHGRVFAMLSLAFR